MYDALLEREAAFQFKKKTARSQNGLNGMLAQPKGGLNPAKNLLIYTCIYIIRVLPIKIILQNLTS